MCVNLLKLDISVSVKYTRQSQSFFFFILRNSAMKIMVLSLLLDITGTFEH